MFDLRSSYFNISTLSSHMMVSGRHDDGEWPYVLAYGVWKIKLKLIFHLLCLLPSLWKGALPDNTHVLRSFLFLSIYFRLDAMGVLFSIFVQDKTVKEGIVGVRSRGEHVSVSQLKIKSLLIDFIQRALWKVWNYYIHWSSPLRLNKNYCLVLVTWLTIAWPALIRCLNTF